MKYYWVILLVVMNYLAVPAQNRPYTASFVGRMGVDTVLVETYTMIDNHLFGKAFIRVPEDYIGQFSIHFYPDGSIREFNMSAMNPTNSSLPFEAKTGAFEYRLDMNCSNDSCIFFNSMKGSETEQIFKHKASKMDFVGGWVPLISLMEWNCVRLTKSGLNAVPLKMINHNLGVYPIDVHYASRTNRNVIMFGGPFLEYTKLLVDRTGRIDEVNGIGTPWNYLVTKHKPIDVDAIAKHMTKSKGIGLPSPEEDITAKIKTCDFQLHYGRPFKRGREIFGGVVPYDSVWRTGAGRATTLSFTESIRIGKTTIPKGQYAIYTIPGKNNWVLIFNKDLTRWPTDPSRDKDFASVLIPATKGNSIQEQFTINIRETKSGGVITFHWADTVALCEFETGKSL